MCPTVYIALEAIGALCRWLCTLPLPIIPERFTFDQLLYNISRLISGKEKKRSLYVKYLPEGTSKELLKVLFPVANNLDIIMTGEGRRWVEAAESGHRVSVRDPPCGPEQTVPAKEISPHMTLLETGA